MRSKKRAPWTSLRRERMSNLHCQKLSDEQAASRAESDSPRPQLHASDEHAESAAQPQKENSPGCMLTSGSGSQLSSQQTGSSRPKASLVKKRKVAPTGGPTTAPAQQPIGIPPLQSSHRSWSPKRPKGSEAASESARVTPQAGQDTKRVKLKSRPTGPKKSVESTGQDNSAVDSPGKVCAHNSRGIKPGMSKASY